MRYNERRSAAAISLVAAMLWVCIPAQCQSSPPNYTIMHLLPPADAVSNGPIYTIPYALNSKGQVVGEYRTAAGGVTTQHFAIWTDGVPTALAPLPEGVRLGATPGSLGRVMAINDFGQVAGIAYTDTPWPGFSNPVLVQHAFIWTTAEFTMLPNPPNHPSSPLVTLYPVQCQGWGINNSGQVAGTCEDNGGVVGGYPVVWVNNSPVQVNNGHCDNGAVPSVMGWSINDLGQIAASGGRVVCDSTAELPAIVSLGGVPMALPVMAGTTFGRAYQVNNAGHAVGVVTEQSADGTYTCHTLLWADGGYTDLASSTATFTGGINNLDQVLVAGNYFHISLWQKGILFDLTTVAAKDPTINFQNYFTNSQQLINDSGQIALYGTAVNPDGTTVARGFLLTPAVTDAIPPATTATPSIAPNANAWNNTPLTVALNATDNTDGSGVKDITYSLAGAQNAPNYTVAGSSASVPISAEGTTTLSYFATDVAGNHELPNAATFRIDKTAPLMSLTGPVNGAVYQLGAAPAANCSATDGVSGLATNPSLVTTGGTANGVGSYTVQCSGATDNAGNLAAPISATYAVQYGFPGFLAPVSMTKANSAKAGQSVAMKWRLARSDGSSVTALSAVTALSSIPLACASGSIAGDVVPADTSGASGLRYDPTSDQFIFHWQTTSSWAGSCRQFRLKLDDATEKSVDFIFK